MSEDSSNKTKAKEYTVKRIEDDRFELWHDDTHLATLTKDEAWPVMIGRVHPEEVIPESKSDFLLELQREDES